MLDTERPLTLDTILSQTVERIPCLPRVVGQVLPSSGWECAHSPSLFGTVTPQLMTGSVSIESSKLPLKSRVQNFQHSMSCIDHVYWEKLTVSSEINSILQIVCSNWCVQGIGIDKSLHVLIVQWKVLSHCYSHPQWMSLASSIPILLGTLTLVIVTIIKCWYIIL